MLARDMSQFKIEFRQFLHPAGLFLVQFLSNLEICKVVVVGIDNGLVRISYKIQSPSRKRVDNGEKFLVVYVPVSLRGVKGSGKESDGMELAFLIPLLKDGADSVGRGVAINRELVFKAGLSQDQGGAHRINEGIKCCFVFVVPIKLPPFHAVSHQRVEGCGQHAKSTDIHAIKIQEAKECLNFFQGQGSFPVLHTLDFDRVHGD